MTILFIHLYSLNTTVHGRNRASLFSYQRFLSASNQKSDPLHTQRFLNLKCHLIKYVDVLISYWVTTNQFLGQLRFVTETAFINICLQTQNNLQLSMFRISFVTLKKYISCFFLLKILNDPKTDYDSKTDFPF